METQLLPVRGETWEGDIVLFDEQGRWQWVLMTGLANVRSGLYCSKSNALESIVASYSANLFTIPGYRPGKGNVTLRQYLRDFFFGGQV